MGGVRACCDQMRRQTEWQCETHRSRYDCPDALIVYFKTPSRPWPSYRLPGALIQLAGKHRIGIVLSFYIRRPRRGADKH
jgi:hypothetical protein